MITREKFESLLNNGQKTCVSVYIPTHRSGHVQEDRLQLKNALKNASHELMDFGLSEKEAFRFLTGGYQLLESEDFWLNLSDGLGLLFGPDYYEYFILPVKVETLVQVGDEFYLRPMIPALTGRQRFFLLALSQNEIRFFEGNKYSITPVIIDDLMPEDMEEALDLDLTATELQSHSGNPNSSSAIFHGHDVGKDHKLKQLKQYFRIIDDGLMKMLHDESAPLVIAAVDYLVPVFREVSTYPHITDIHIGGNPEHDDPVLLHEKAWTIIDDFNKNEMTQRKNAFEEQLPKQKASTELSSVIRAADEGKVETLFINKSKHLWGHFDPQNRAINIHSEKEKQSKDLLELAAKITFEKGGRVYNIDAENMPAPDYPVNAIYRY